MKKELLSLARKFIFMLRGIIVQVWFSFGFLSFLSWIVVVEFSVFKKLAVIAASLLLEDARKVIECIFGKNLEFQEFLF